MPENSYNHGHHGLIQWDSQRWPRVAAWIRSQGGDPWDVRWQTRAFVAEGRAKPGDALYDNKNTENGFRALERSKGNVDLAIQGMRGIERFGAGEEGGRAALARKILPSLHSAPTASAPSPAGTSAAAVSDAEVFAARQRILNGGRDPKDQALVERYKAEQAKPVKVDVTDASAAKIGKARMSDETRQHLQNVQTVLRARHGNVLPFLHPHAHLSSAARTAIDNSRHRQIAMTHNPTFNISGGDHSSMLAEAHRTASRGAADLVRNMSVMES